MSTDDVFPPAYGYLYAVVNSAWPNMVKLGHAGSVRKRLQGYQTGDPHRAYRMLAWSDVLPESGKAETEMLEHFAAARVAPNPKCEWFRITEAHAVAYMNTRRAQPMVLGVPHTFEAEQEWYSDGLDVE